ncbi:MAG: hypothetical protein E2600_04090 [Chryseobacterium sp.]|nr:hypothetical protein [Chryseobacterium sp.]
MKHYLFIFLIILISCKKEEIKIIDKSFLNSINPSHFNISNNILLELPFEVEEIINRQKKCGHNYILKCSNKNSTRSWYDCSNEMFFDFNENEKKLIFQSKIESNYDCNDSGGIFLQIHKIPLGQIGVIDTISTYTGPLGGEIVNDINPKKNISIIIYPKYNMESIEYITYRDYYDKEVGLRRYKVDSGKTKEPIFFELPNENNGNGKGYAIFVKKDIEKLVENFK